MAWPLTGRSNEIQAIDVAVTTPDVPGILVCGPQGVGKSRLARQALADAAARGYETRWSTATLSGLTVPMGALATWAPPGVTDTVTLVRGVIDALTQTRAGRGVVVGVDDAHLLDDLSTFVIHQIVARRAATVVLTVRDGEPVPRALQEIWNVDRFDRIDLQSFSLDGTASLVSAALGGKLDPIAVQRLWTLTRGNVLYLRHIVEQELAHDRIVLHGGYWRWIGEPVMPATLVELVESRLASVPPDARDVVDALAVDEPISLAALTRITSAAAVENADTHDLVTVEPAADGVQVRLAHPLYGEVRRRRAPLTRLRRLRSRVAAELAVSEHADQLTVMVRRAALSLDSDVEPDAALLVRAAQGAVWLADLPLAERLASAAARVSAEPEPQFVRAHALSWLGRGEEADQVLAEIDQTTLDDTDRARFVFLRASNLLWALGDPKRAKALIDDASHVTAPHARTYLDAFLTVYWFATDHPHEANEAAKPLDLQQLPAVVGAEVAWALTVIAADAGRSDEAITTAETGYAAATRSFDAPHMRFNIADAHVSALTLAGRATSAVDVAEEARRQARDMPGAAQLLGAAIAGRAALANGQLDTASALLEQAAVGLTAAGYGAGWGYRYHIPWATALAMRGDTQQASTAISALAQAHRTFRALDYEVSLARAWTAAAEGAVRSAVDIVSSAAERAAADGQFAAEVLCRQTAAQFGDGSGTRRLRELEALVDGPRVTLAAQFAEALDSADTAALEQVSEGFEAAGDLIAAVDATSHAAVIYRRQGLRGSALRCVARAEDLAVRCGGAATPALREAAQPLPLTDREREIVMLIGMGLSNREVAQRLTLSVRTVESHIYRAMSKTGTSNRDELAALRPRH